MLLAICYLFSPAPVLAAACPASGCPAAQFCARDARIPDGSACYATCRSSSGGSGGCTGTDRCVSITGTEVCVPESSPLVTGSGVTRPSCATGRTCPSDHTYQCVSEQCFLANGQPCTNDEQCLTGSACVPATTGTGNVCTTSSVPVSGGTEAPEAPFIPITPTLGAPIPGVSLSPATKDGDYVAVPFLAEYVNGVYRYLVGIALVAAIVMVVYGGFRYLVGSSLGDIKSGKKIIVDALAGMLIVLAAYMILNTVNPATLDLSILRIAFVDRIDIDNALLYTQVDTAVVGDELEREGSGAPAAGAPVSSYTDCPISLSTPADDPPRSHEARTEEFKTEIASSVTGGNTRSRVLRMAEAAQRCGVRFNSCGAFAEEIFENAGSARRGFQTHSLSREIVNYLDAHNCETYSRECNPPATAAAFEYIRSQVAGWPEIWTNELQPGDTIAVFNANSAVAGLHRAIFTGWASNGRAQVIQGAWTRFIYPGTICLTSECRNPQPLVRVFQPRP